MHEQNDRERAGSAGRAEIADDRELPGLEGDLLDLGRLGLPCAGREEQQDDQEEEGQLASLEGLRFVSNMLSVYGKFLNTPEYTPNGSGSIPQSHRLLLTGQGSADPSRSIGRSLFSTMTESVDKSGDKV